MWYTSACRVQTNPVSGLRKPWGGWTLGSTNVEGGPHSPFPVKTKLDKVTQIINCYAHLHRNLLVRSITSAYGQGMVQSSQFQNLWASSTLHGSKTATPLETYSRSEQTKPFGDHQDHPPTMRVGYLIRFQGRLLPYTNTGTVQDISNFMSRVGHTSSKHCLLVCPLHPWSSL